MRLERVTVAAEASEFFVLGAVSALASEAQEHDAITTSDAPASSERLSGTT
jgi:hypothetical protein